MIRLVNNDATSIEDLSRQVVDVEIKFGLYGSLDSKILKTIVT